MAAGYGTSPHFIFSGHDGENRYFQLMELLFGGVPGRPRGDGLDGHAWWPLFSATPIEYIENYYPVLIESYRPVKDSGGAGLHRGGAGIEKIYRLLEPGKVSIHDDREIVPPWGINGGLFGGTSSKALVRAGSDASEKVPSKIDNLEVAPGDRIVFITAGSGGWGDPLDREAGLVARDVAYDLVSAEKAASDYGVILDGAGQVDVARTNARRADMRKERGEPSQFSFGYFPPVQEAAE
jgi:N-methylhydantoinase B